MAWIWNVKLCHLQNDDSILFQNSYLENLPWESSAGFHSCNFVYQNKESGLLINLHYFRKLELIAK